MTEHRVMINGIAVSARYSDRAVKEIFLPLLNRLAALRRQKGRRILVMLAAPPGCGKTTLLSFLEKRKGLLDGVCITGGEPTLQRDLPALLSAVKALGYAVKLDTNGYRPEILKDLVGQGLVDYVAMDVKNSPARYAETAGLPELDIARIEESLTFLLSDSVDYELRTTVAEPLHDRQAMADIVRWLGQISPDNQARRFFIQPFADRDTVIFAGLKTPETAELTAFQEILTHCAEQVSIRGV